jgi:hypothetical protein
MYSLVFDKAYFDVISAGILFVNTAIQSFGDLLSFYWGRKCLMDRFDKRRIVGLVIRVNVRETDQRSRTMLMGAIVNRTFHRTYSPNKCHPSSLGLSLV